MVHFDCLIVFFIALFLSSGIAPAGGPSTPYKAIVRTKNIVKNVVIKNLASQEAPIIYLDPHADDETLTYGVDILNSIREGHEVKVILLSESVFSDAFDMLNGKNRQGAGRRDRFVVPS